jgi:peptide chain release factor 1
MDYASIIDKKRAAHRELEQAISDPSLFDRPERAAEVTREHRQVGRVLELWDELGQVKRQLEEGRELVKGGDEEMAALAEGEVAELEEREAKLEEELQYALLPRDPSEDRDAILEVRAGTGGDEASLFAADLLRMYTRYAEERGWKVEPLSSSPSEVGGFKEATVKVTGEEVFRYLKYESGVHRVQRVPTTETQGRIHTSTATVAVLPEAEEVDIEIRPDELRIEVCRSGGAGGQHVNRTESAVQIFHLPSGLMVRCEEERSQGRNKEKGMAILRAKLLALKQEEVASQYSEQRRALIGSGGREEKIRTYNFPQNRVTDHRIGLTLNSLDRVIEGALGQITERLQASEMAMRLEEVRRG